MQDILLELIGGSVEFIDLLSLSVHFPNHMGNTTQLLWHYLEYSLKANFILSAIIRFHENLSGNQILLSANNHLLIQRPYLITALSSLSYPSKNSPPIRLIRLRTVCPFHSSLSSHSLPSFLLSSIPPFLLPSFPPILLLSFPPSFLPSFPRSFLLSSFRPSLVVSFPFILYLKSPIGLGSFHSFPLFPIWIIF